MRKENDLKAFREAYSEISRMRVAQPLAGIIALTATATAEVEKSCVDNLQLTSHKTYRISPEKSNIRYL